MQLRLLLASADDPGAVIGIVVATIFIVAVVVVLLARAREFFFPRRIRHRMRRYFGRSMARLRGHDKAYPGYDLASISLATLAVLEQNLQDLQPVGSITSLTTMAGLLAQLPNGGPIPGPPVYAHVPVGIDQDDSLVANCIYFGRLRPGKLGAGQERQRDRVAVFLFSARTGAPNLQANMADRAGPIRSITISIACERKETAHLFFKELEEARQRLSIYRGKVIDAAVGPGGISSIAFARIQQVRDSDLVLPQEVRSLIDGAIVRFYTNQDVLREMGVEMKRGILFHSPPGTGKTSVCLYLAGLLPNFTVCFISGKRLLFPREVCAMARYLQPTMLVFEDIDLIAQERDSNGLATVLGELMNQIDGCEPNDQVLFIMNTNSMDRLEAAVRNRPGRVDQIVHIPLPTLSERAMLIRTFAKSIAVSAEAVDALAAASDGVTPALLKEVVKRAAVMAVSRQRQAPGEPGVRSAGSAIELRKSDLLLALEQVLSMRAEVLQDDPASKPHIGFSG